MKTVKFNVNNYVRVKLTDEGRKIHRQQWDELVKNHPRAAELGYRPPEEDSEGWSSWQLHNLMQFYGPHIFLGCRMPFDTAIEFCVPDDQPAPEEPIDDLSKWSIGSMYSQEPVGSLLRALSRICVRALEGKDRAKAREAASLATGVEKAMKFAGL